VQSQAIAPIAPKFLLPFFGQENNQATDDGFIYRLIEDKVYDSFIFGKISNQNLNNEMVLTLIMEEPEIWKSLFSRNNS
jgi:hypothetical protein